MKVYFEAYFDAHLGHCLKSMMERYAKIVEVTIMQIWKSPFMLDSISKQYPENFAFLSLRILKLLNGAIVSVCL